MSIIQKLEILHCDDDDDASACVDNVSAFFEFAKTLAKDNDLRLSEVYHAMSMCEPCMIEESEKNCAVIPYPTSLPDLTCGGMKMHLYATASIAVGYDISPSDAFEAASMCEGCLGGDISNCSTQVQGQLKCADIRDHLKCDLIKYSYEDEGCSSDESESCRSLKKELQTLLCNFDAPLSEEHQSCADEVFGENVFDSYSEISDLRLDDKQEFKNCVKKHKTIKIL